MKNARDTMNHIANRLNIQPEARRIAVANTLRQMGEIAADLPLSLDGAARGFHFLSFARVGDTDATASRRRTCAEIVKPLPRLDGAELSRQWTEQELANVFAAVAAHFHGSTDPRQRTIHETAAREARELRENGSGGFTPREEPSTVKPASFTGHANKGE